MTESATFRLGPQGRRGTWPRPVTSGRGTARAVAVDPHAAADELWREHGWSLGGSTVAVVVALVLAASYGIALLG